MPKFNADEQVMEPIEVVLGGKTYLIQEIKQSMFDKIKEIANTVKDGPESVFQQLSVLLGEDIAVLREVDLRKAGAILRFIIDTVTAQMEGKTGNA